MREVRDGRWGVHPTTIIMWLSLMYGIGWVWIYGIYGGLQEWADSTLYIGIYLYTLGEIPLGVWLRVLASVG